MSNPSRRGTLKVKELHKGILEYESGAYKTLIGIETTNSGILQRIYWDVSQSLSPGKSIDLCPRDIQILLEVIKYLRTIGCYPQEEEKDE